MESGVLSEMGLIMFTWVFLGLFFNVFSEEVSVVFLQTPASITNQISANFTFKTSVSGNCSTTTCKLNNDAPSLCPSREVFYAGLKDGHHTCEVCSIGNHGVGCSSYKWIVDTVAPTAYVAAATSFTSSTNVSVNVSFNKPCNGEGGFQCTSVDSCNLLVYGAGQVIPTTLNTIQPNLRYSLIVSLASNVQYGRVLLAMDKNFCTDAAGNKFKTTHNSNFSVDFDRRSALVSLRTRIPERPVRLDGETITVPATNTYQNLELYLNFDKPVTNSIDDIINSIHTTEGSLVPIIGNNSLGNSRFGFRVTNISRLALVTVSLDSELLASKYGTHVSPMAPFSFIYDSQRPAVKVSTKSNDVRTRHRSLQMLIRFMKPVLGFNSSYLNISGGYLQGFHEVTASAYSVDIQFEADVVSINVPENITMDAAGNGNLASNILQVKHYSLPAVSSVLSSSGTATFLFAALAAGMVSISIASLQSMGSFGEISSITDPTSNLFRMAGHIQIFALSRWLPVALPVQYYELARGLRWSIPYFSLPWDMGHDQSVMAPSSLPAKLRPHSSKPFDIEIFKHIQPRDVYVDKTYTSRFRSPQTLVECKAYLEASVNATSEYNKSKAHSDGWEHFNKRIFWLAVIGGSLILVHALLLLILKYRKTKSEKPKSYGALIFPRFEIFLINLALPCVCEAAAAIIKGGSTSGTIVGALLFGAVSFLLLASFLFLLVGITFGKLLQYKEINKEGHRSHRYHELTRVILGPGKRGQWTWRNQSNSVYLTIFGPLFEDLRGPTLYRFVAENQGRNDDRIIASGDKTVDAKAPFMQKLFGIIRIYQSFIETIKRVSVAILTGANFENKRPTKAPTIISLCITSFQLVFMVLEKPFMKKEVQLVEVISVFCEVGIFTCCWLLLEMKFTDKDERNMMIIMISLFVLSFLPQFINMYYALYRQIKKLDPAKESFFRGLLTALIGVMGYCILEEVCSNPDESGSNPEEADSNPEEAAKAAYNAMEPFSDEKKEPLDPSGTNEKPWAKVREHVESSFSKKSGQTTTTDPSTSAARWSELLGNKNAQSSSLTTSGDAEPKTDSTET